MIKLLMKIAAVVLGVALAPAWAAQYDWSNTCTTWHFNPNNVRDPTIVYNNTALAYYPAPVTGYTGTVYDFQPKNFAPNTSTTGGVCSTIGLPPHSSVACADTWTDIPLDQFGVPASAKEIILTGNSYIIGPNQWTGTIYAWFRKPGSTWQLSPIFDGGYMSSVVIHAPVGLIPPVGGGPPTVPAIEMAWRGEGLVLPPAAGPNDQAAFVGILTGWCE